MTDAALTGTWTIDPIHSRIGFSSRHAMVARVRGAFSDVAGTIVIDQEDSSRSSAHVVVQMASIDTRNADRDNHLRSPDFFDVENYPEMVLTSTQVEEVDDGGFIVSGDLTIRDITRPMSIPLSLLGIDTDAFGIRRAGFEGTRRIQRKDWGVTWNTPLDSGGLMVSDKITLEFELSLTRQEDAAAPSADEGHGEEGQHHEGDHHDGGDHGHHS